MHSYRTVLCTSLSTAFFLDVRAQLNEGANIISSSADVYTVVHCVLFLSKYPGLVMKQAAVWFQLVNCTNVFFSVTVPFMYLCYKLISVISWGMFGACLFFTGRGTKWFGTVNTRLAHSVWKWMEGWINCWGTLKCVRSYFIFPFSSHSWYLDDLDNKAEKYVSSNSLVKNMLLLCPWTNSVSLKYCSWELYFDCCQLFYKSIVVLMHKH